MSTRPNVLIITVDGMRYDALRCNGNRLALSPHLDALANDGVRCDRAYCSQPICMPCRASMMTGRYPSAHGVWQNGVELVDHHDMLGDLFNQAGYSTALMGKAHFRPWLNSLTPDENGSQPEHLGDGPYYGFEKARVCDHSQRDRYYDWVDKHFPRYSDLARNPRMDRPAGASIAWKSTLPAEATKSRYISDLSIDIIRQHRADRPLLLWSSFIDPHHPYNPPSPFADAFDSVDFPSPPSNEGPSPKLPRHYHEWVKRLARDWGHHDTAQTQWQQVRRMYQGKVGHVDHEVGRVLQALEDQGIADDTVVVFLSDHGTMLGDYGLMQVGEYSQEPLIHIPMIWRLPKAMRRSSPSQTSEILSVVDLLPTLLDLCGIPIPSSVQGRSLKPLLQDGEPLNRDGVLVESRWGQWPADGMRTLVTDRYKLTVCTTGEGELYDLHEDPFELHNLFGLASHSEVQMAMLARFAETLLITEDPMPIRTGCW